jgi:hypothetical protein
MLNLDAHILLFAPDGKLSARQQSVLSGDRWGISSIVLWETAKLDQKRRIALGLDSPLHGRTLSRIHVWQLNREVCMNLATLDFASVRPTS